MKLTTAAYDYYVALGPTRTHAEVARKFGVTRRAVSKRAMQEHWEPRVVEIERKARERHEAKALESLEEMNSRHLQMLRVIQVKALESLKNLQIKSGFDAVKALDIAIRNERLIRGEPGERQSVTIAETIRNEFTAWMRMDVTNENDPEIVTTVVPHVRD